MSTKTPALKKIALVYDRVNKWGGAERVLLALHDIFPDAPLYTSVYNKKNAKWAKVFPRIYTSFLQNIPFAKSNHEFLAPLMPFAFESFNFDDYDLVISVTSEAAKGVKTKPSTYHICYCLTPTRYLWSHNEEYFENKILKFISKPILTILKKWDIKAAGRPNLMISISTEVQKRINKYYNRKSEIIFPPVNIKTFYVNMTRKGKYFLIVSRLVGYKKVALAIEAFNKLGYPLVIVGIGREEARLKSISNKNIKFTGQISDKRLHEYYKNAKALIMPQEEDFGIVAVESQARGIPVIAYGKGGVIDTVIPNTTGIFFEKQTAESLSSAVLKFEKMKFNNKKLIKNARMFSQTEFKRQFIDLVQKMLE